MIRAQSATIWERFAVAASRIIGRKSSGTTTAMTGAEAMVVLSGQAGAAFDLNSQKLTGVGAPASAGDALIKGTRLTADEMLAGTSGLYLKAQGAGVNPVYAAVPPTPLTVAETEVFSGTAPGSWTDLDLSGTIGSNPALVLLKIDSGASADTNVAFRKDGDTDEFYTAAALESSGCALIAVNAPHMSILVATSASGVIEWKSESTAGTTTVDIIAYIK